MPEAIGDKIKLKTAYHILCKGKGDKKFMGYGGGYTQTKKIYYAIYSIHNEKEKKKFERHLAGLRELNEGVIFKIVIVKDYYKEA